MTVRVAVAGASGYVGSTLVEHLMRRGVEVVPLIHSSGNAWRVARFGIPLIPVDLLAPRDLGDTLRGCTHVVNCSRDGERLMLTGLHNLLGASREAGVSRFVHLSSVAVYGDPPSPDSVTEGGATAPAKGSYGRLKLRQDELVVRACRRGLPGVILCPPNIVGPASGFLLEVLAALRQTRFALLEDGDAPCSMVDVANLCHAVECALEAGPPDGRRYFVTFPERVSWRRLVERLAAAGELEGPVPRVSRADLERLRERERPPTTSLGRALKHLVSSDLRHALRRDPLWEQVDTWLRRSVAFLGPGVEDALRLSIQGPAMPLGPEDGPDLHVRLCLQQLRGVDHSCDRARRELGYRPPHSFAASMDAFEAWLHTMRGMSTESWDLARLLY